MLVVKKFRSLNISQVFRCYKNQMVRINKLKPRNTRRKCNYLNPATSYLTDLWSECSGANWRICREESNTNDKNNDFKDRVFAPEMFLYTSYDAFAAYQQLCATNSCSCAHICAFPAGVCFLAIYVNLLLYWNYKFRVLEMFSTALASFTVEFKRINPKCFILFK